MRSAAKVFASKGFSAATVRDVAVVIVEDDPMIMRRVLRMLEGESGISAAQGGADVLALMNEALWQDVDVALVDLLLPRPTGNALLGWLAVNAPHVRRVAMSGWGPDRLDEDANVHLRLLKPFTLDELLAAVRG